MHQKILVGILLIGGTIGGFYFGKKTATDICWEQVKNISADLKQAYDNPHPTVHVDIRFLKGRIKFISPDGGLLRGTKMNGSNNAAPFPSMVIIFKPS